MASGTSQREQVQPAALARLLDGDHADLRARIRTVLERPEFDPVTALTTADAVLGAPIGRREASG